MMFDCEDDPPWLDYLVFLFPPFAIAMAVTASMLFGDTLRAKVIRKSEPVRVEIVDQGKARGE